MELKNYILLIFILFQNFGYAQNQETNEIQETMPKFVPVAPDVASLGQFGDIPVNLASGMVNLTVPIYTINLGQYQLPIYLSYHHNGLLVDQDPGIVGLGWNLVAGGSITRELRGKPDNQHHHKVSWHNIYTDLVNFEQLSQNSKLSYCVSYEANQIDTEPDKFNININGADASFVYDENGNPVFFRQKNYYVNQNTNQEFEVINDRGIKFLFSEVEMGSSDINSNQGEYGYISSWKISRIITPNSDKTIDFTYFDSNDINFNPHFRVYEKETYSETKRHNFVSGQSYVWTVNLIGRRDSTLTDGFYPSCIPQDYGGGRINSTTIEQKLINTISFPDGKMKFDIKVIPHDIGSKANNPFYLDKIKIYDKFNNLKFEYHMIYKDTLHKTNYNLLRKIEKYGVDNDGNLVKEPFYKFLYYGMPPNELNKLSKDTWGYYNGKYNTSLLTGDRNVNFETTRLGALKKIIYPTEGFTEIEYEQNTSSTLDPLFSGGGQCSPNIFNQSRIIRAINFTDNPILEIRDTIEVPCEQMVKITLSASSGLIPGGGNSGSNMSDANIEFLNLPLSDLCNPLNENCNDGCRTSVSSHSPENLTSYTDWPDYAFQNTKSYFYLPAGTKIVLHVRTDDISTGRGSASVRVDYFDCQDYNLPIGGIRVKSIKTCEKEAANNCQIKNFKYNLSNGLSSGRILSLPYYMYMVNYGFDCGENTEMGRGQFAFQASGSMIPMAGFSGSPVVYERVETIENNGIDKGKTIQYFSVGDFMVKEDVTEPPFPYYLQKGWKNGNLIKEEKYKWKNGGYEKVSEQLNEYQSFDYQPDNNNYHGSIGFKAFRKEYSFGIVQNPQDLTAYDYITYQVIPQFYQLVSSTTKNFYDNQQVVTSKHFEYDPKTGNLVNEYFSDSKGNIHKKSYFYVDNIVDNQSLGEPSLGLETLDAYQKLQKYDDLHPDNKNILTKPIQVQSFVNNQQVSKIREEYKNFGDIQVGNDIQKNISTKVILSAKSDENSLEEKIVYSAYDTFGNPIAVLKKNGVTIFYVWGYNHSKIIAKIIGCDPYKSGTTIQQLADEARNLSDVDVDAASENDLINSLQNLRSSLSQDCNMTAYTYDPLIGVTSIIDEKGEIQFYKYDAFGRLQRILDKQGNILKEYEYNYDSTYNTPWPIEANVNMVNHNIANSEVTFEVDVDPNNSGSGAGLNVEWTLLTPGTIIQENSNQIVVKYDCYDTNNLPVLVSCKITDQQFTDNFIEVTGYFNWSGCLNSGSFNVNLTYENNEEDTGNEQGGNNTNQVYQQLTSINLSLNNIQGGNGNNYINYKWYYKNTGSSDWILLGDTGTNNHYFSNDTNLISQLCGLLVSFRCIVTDSFTGQQLIFNENNTPHFIFCNN